MKLISGNRLLTTEGDVWSHHRNIMAPTFSVTNLKNQSHNQNSELSNDNVNGDVPFTSLQHSRANVSQGPTISSRAQRHINHDAFIDPSRICQVEPNTYKQIRNKHHSNQQSIHNSKGSTSSFSNLIYNVPSNLNNFAGEGHKADGMRMEQAELNMNQMIQGTLMLPFITINSYTTMDHDSDDQRELVTLINNINDKDPEFNNQEEINQQSKQISKGSNSPYSSLVYNVPTNLSKPAGEGRRADGMRMEQSELNRNQLIHGTRMQQFSSINSLATKEQVSDDQRQQATSINSVNGNDSVSQEIPLNTINQRDPDLITDRDLNKSKIQNPNFRSPESHKITPFHGTYMRQKSTNQRDEDNHYFNQREGKRDLLSYEKVSISAQGQSEDEGRSFIDCRKLFDPG